MKRDFGPFGLIPGHSFIDPYGARVDGLPAEYFVNRRVINSAAHAAATMAFDNYCVVDYPSAARSIDAIGPQHKELQLLNSPFAIELHFNADVKETVNYAVAFYRRGDPIAERLSHMLRDAMAAGLNQFVGLKKFFVIDLPDQNWRNLESVMNSPVPLVLLEPCFMTAADCRDSLITQSFHDWLGNVIMMTAKRLLDNLIYETAVKQIDRALEIEL